MSAPVLVAHTAGAETSSGTTTWTDTFGVGESAIAVIAVNGFGVPAVTCGGVSMTAMGTPFEFNGSGYYIGLFIRIASPTDNFGSVTLSATASAFNLGGISCGATGVTSVGSVASNNASNTSITVTSSGSATDEIVVFGFAVDTGGIATGISSVSGFTSDYNTNLSSVFDLLIGHAAGTGSNITGTATSPASNWGAFAARLVGAGGNSFTDHANTTITFGGTKDGAIHGNITDHANTTITFGGTRTGKLGIKNTANRSITFTPTVSGPSGPWDQLLEHMNAGAAAYMCMVGDSTVIGDVSDTAIGGWPGRVGIILGQHYNYNVVMWTGGWTGSAFEYTTSTTLFSAVGTRPTLTIYNGGVGATGIFTNDQAYLTAGGSGLNAYIPTDPWPDVIMIGTGINDMDLDERTASEFTSDMQTFVYDMQAQYANPVYDPSFEEGATGSYPNAPNAASVPIIITDENVSSVDAGYATIQPGYNAVFTAYGVGDPPITPILQASNVSGVWMLDTQFYFGYVWNTDLMSDGYHPLGVGYQVEAVGMVGTLAPDVLQNITDHANTTITFGETITGTVVNHFTDHANTTITFGDTITGRRGVSSTANRAITFTPTITGHRGVNDHANRSVGFSFNASSGNHYTDTANRVVTFAGSPAGSHGIHEHANLIMVWSTAEANRMSLHDHANLALVIETDTVGQSDDPVYFTVNGFYYAVQQVDQDSNTSTPNFTGMTGGFITFTPRVPEGFTILTYVSLGGGNIGTAAIALTPIQGRIIPVAAGDEGTVWQLCAITVDDAVGVQLLANTPIVSDYLASQGIDQLIYDVSFTQVTYAGDDQSVKPFAFVAPTFGTSVSITDPGFETVPYAPLS
jgi:hypothetical protein